ncbi:hypothetical protein [Sphingomonas sp. SRS2]|uniref:hypothetical protein n=1 Tax=Sphingomonas sp. SRS2 TaxID=133190 RepID=UPI0006183FE1|nr:hypothetical protein [Sphingomonas sp. SRS2]KKC24349.1 hypothetical protein WP12_19835 [Sphingomonas sp. SRS2]
MTTEIAVINRLGVAIAADSAVTVSGFGTDKVFDTGDKLFELSERFPIALMVNGSMDFLGVPWEIVAKEFRCAPPADADKLSIKQWMQRFLDFVSNHPAVKDPDIDRWVAALVREEAANLAESVRGLVSEAADEENGNENLQSVLRRLFLEATTDQLKILQTEPTLESLEGITHDDVMRKIRSQLAALNGEIYPFKANADEVDIFTQLIAHVLLKDIDRVNSSGLIICGFGANETGAKDLFPSLYAVGIDGHICGRLRYQKSHDVTISRGTGTGSAISFAQTDVIDRLLKGIDNRFVDASREFIEQNVARAVQENFERAKLKIIKADGTEIAPEDMGGFLGQLIAGQFESKFAVNLTAEFEKKFKETIALMPKQDLIELAEALVNITAIERKASDDAGTVGGPIDVALITRAEGFVWVKRKHHFRADLNPRYMWRRFGQFQAAEKSGDEATHP